MDIDELVQAIEARDNETVKKLAAIDVQTKSVGTDVGTMKEQIAQIEQQMAAGGGSFTPGNAERSVGGLFVQDDRVKAFLESGNRGKVDVRIKASLTSLTTDAAGSVGAGIAPTRAQGIDLLPRRRPVVRSLLPVVQMTGGSVEVPVQKARNNNAAPVAEGTGKPQSDVQLELKTFNARVIAHWMKASRQVIDDIPQLRGLIDTELLDGLKESEDNQLLNGDGTGQNLNGLIPQATAYAAPIIVPDINMIDVIGLGALQVSRAHYQPDGVILNDGDWLQIRLLKNADGDYLFGPPGAEVAPRLFGLPVVPTTAMAQGDFLIGAFQAAATIYDRWDARIEVGFENDDFTKNLVTILGEERLALAVKRRSALVYGSFEDAMAAPAP